MAAFLLSMKSKLKQLHRLHRNLAASIRLLGLNAQEIAEGFQISREQAKKILIGRPVWLEQSQLDIVTSVLRNQLPYALPARIGRLLNNDKTRQSFVTWVHSAALMMDVYDSMQDIQDQCDFINPMDPFLAGLYTVDAGMRETRQLLIQIHQKCPQFDSLFFYGTRFLERIKGIEKDAPDTRVPSSVDVLLLSPEDSKIRETLLKEQQCKS
jgi:hypothetical protein